jgi:hypothetical protein
MDYSRSFRIILYILTYLIAYQGSHLMNKPQYFKMYWIGLIGFINVELMTYLTTTKYKNIINNAYNKCYVVCYDKWCKYLLKFRGEDYFLTFNGQDKIYRVKNCLLSLWGVLHFILFALIGFFIPDVFYEVIIISILYEYIEYLLYNCHDALDIVLNIIGYLFGTFLFKIYLSKK